MRNCLPCRFQPRATPLVVASGVCVAGSSGGVWFTCWTSQRAALPQTGRTMATRTAWPPGLPLTWEYIGRCSGQEMDDGSQLAGVESATVEGARRWGFHSGLELTVSAPEPRCSWAVTWPGDWRNTIALAWPVAVRGDPVPCVSPLPSCRPCSVGGPLPGGMAVSLGGPNAFAMPECLTCP